MESRHFSERGQALVLIALAAIALFAIAGLAIDGSNKYSDRRHAQNAADTASLAASLKKADLLTAGQPDEICSTANPLPWTTYCDTIIQAAFDQASANGYDGMLNNDVEVYSPPISGPYATVAAKNMYVQVIIKSDVDTYFMRVVGINQSRNIVQATALSGKGGKIANGASVVSMDPNPGCGNGSFNVGGNGTINLDGGGMFVNSSGSCGYSQTSCSVTLTMGGGAGISSAGSPINQSCGTPVPQNTTQSQILIPDEIVYPKKPLECNTAAPSATPLGGSKWRLHPGKYTSFPPNGLGNNKDIYLDAGVYCVDGDIQWTGSNFNLLDGTTGVTLYITNGHQFDINIGSTINLDASNSGDYQGYLVILEGTQNTHPTCTINGGSNINLNGTIFAPYCNITINGNNTSTSTINAQIIGWDVKLNGGNEIIINYNPDDNAKIKRRVGLMK
ncbi:MAG: pilus assembly protein TadG-related protein [Bacteroidota bacterium]